MRAVDAEIDDVEQGLLDLAVGEDAECIVGHGAIVAGPLDGVLERIVGREIGDGLVEVGLRLAAVLQGSLPESTLLLVAAPEGQHDGQGDLALAEVVADGLAERRLMGGIVEDIVCLLYTSPSPRD